MEIKNILSILVLISFAVVSLSFVSAGCGSFAFGDMNLSAGVVSYCDLQTGNFVPQKVNNSVCMNDFECQSGFCIMDKCLNSVNFIQNLYQLPSPNCPSNITSPGCINRSNYPGLSNGTNFSALCNFAGYSCYVCNNGYIWNSTLGNCRIAPLGTLTNKTTNRYSTGGSWGSPGCVTTWLCDSWSPCIAGKQTRTCDSKVLSSCYADPKKKPTQSQTCTETVSTTDYVEPVSDLGSQEIADPLKALKIILLVVVVILLMVVLIWFIVWKMKQSKYEKQKVLASVITKK